MNTYKVDKRAVKLGTSTILNAFEQIGANGYDLDFEGGYKVSELDSMLNKASLFCKGDLKKVTCDRGHRALIQTDRDIRKATIKFSGNKLVLDREPIGYVIKPNKLRVNRLYFRDVYQNCGDAICCIPGMAGMGSVRELICCYKLKTLSDFGIFSSSAILSLEECDTSDVEDGTNMCYQSMCKEIRMTCDLHNIRTFRGAFRDCIDLEVLDFGENELPNLMCVSDAFDSCVLAGTTVKLTHKAHEKFKELGVTLWRVVYND